MKHFQFIGRRLVPILMSAAVLCASLSGCAQKDTTVPADTNAAVPTLGEMSAERRLCISAVSENVGFTTISADQLGGNFDEDIVYLNLIDVNITVDGTSYPLENAIRDGLITVEEIFAYARIDARNGICSEIPTTNHGLTYFTYRYPEYDLRLTYDVYETPDGKNHLIKSLGVYKVGSDVSSSYIDDETGKNIDLEDWGITFEVVDVTPSAITLNCTQSGGQYIGHLQVDFFGLYSDDYKYLSRMDESQEVPRQESTVPFAQNTETQFTISWEPYYGSLEKGNYYLQLTVKDVFDESQVHPLMEDFYTSQSYWIPFTIS